MAKKVRNSAGANTGFGGKIAFALILGVFPMAAMTAGALPALAAGISLLVVTILTVLCAAVLRKHLHGALGMASVLVLAATFTVGTSMLVQAFWPQAYDAIGGSVIRISVCMMAFPWAWMTVSDEDGEKQCPGNIIAGAAAVAVGMAVLGVLREFLSAGTVFSAPVGGLKLLPSLSSVPGGLLVLGIVLGLCRIGKADEGKTQGEVQA